MDMFLALFPVADVVGFGAEHSSLGGVLQLAAAEAGFKVIPDFAPQEVVFIRSDQFPFVKKGVPALFITNGIGSADRSIDGAKVALDWVMNVYHSRGDDMSQVIHFPSLAKFARANFFAGVLVANGTARPTWNRGDYFGDKFSAR
jgi:Zn-dependent M28 family amino/carboxypeptidase